MTNLDEAFSPIDAHAVERAGTILKRDSWTPIVPVPEDVKFTSEQLKKLKPAGHEFIAGWRYHDVNGRLIGHVVRYDRPANGEPATKTIRPITYCEGPVGTREWRCKGFPEPRPLYRLPDLAARPGAPVLIVEGEKTADAAAKRFDDYIVITSPGGSMAAGKADWCALAGRRVTIWPDADAPGARYAADVADLAHRAGAEDVRVVRLPNGLPEGWDLADDLPEGVTDEDLVALLSSAPAVETVANFLNCRRGYNRRNASSAFPRLAAIRALPAGSVGIGAISCRRSHHAEGPGAGCYRGAVGACGSIPRGASTR